jgi:hypothetical protein
MVNSHFVGAKTDGKRKTVLELPSSKVSSCNDAQNR